MPASPTSFPALPTPPRPISLPLLSVHSLIQALAANIVFFVVADLTIRKCIQPDLRILRILFFLPFSVRMKYFIVAHYTAVVGLALTNGGYHQGTWVMQEWISGTGSGASDGLCQGGQGNSTTNISLPGA